MNKSREIAVIFERCEQIEGDVSYFSPVNIVSGKFDKDDGIFIDRYGNKYDFISNIDVLEYGFALRTTLGNIQETYRKKNINDSVRAYYREVKKNIFYFGFSKKDMSHAFLVAEDKRSKLQTLIDDLDLNRIDFSSGDISIDTKSIIDYTKSRVIGQNEAIEDIVTVLWVNAHSKIKKNMLLVGPTGVGKTEIIKTISSKLDIPMVIISASGLTKSGYVGESVENILLRLYNKSDGNIKKLERGIVILDEFDKLSIQARDSISTSGVQEELLKFTEGCEYDLNISKNAMEKEIVTINTEGITFIAMGAFADLGKQNKTKKSNSIGFGANITLDNDDCFYDDVTSDDLIKYGIIAELVGRFPVIIPLNPISEDTLVKILDNPNTDLLLEKKNILLNAGIKLKINNPEVVKKKIAHIAIQKNIGVRGLNSVLERTFVKAMREISLSEGKYNELIIDENTVDDPKKFILRKKV